MASSIIDEITRLAQEAIDKAKEQATQTKPIQGPETFEEYQTRMQENNIDNWVEYNLKQARLSITNTIKNVNISTTYDTTNNLIIDQKTMAQNYTNYMNKVTDMLVNDGPIYDVWIKFQIGLSDPIIFDSRSRSKNENLIASLEMKKSCAGTANDFTLVIQYDPFDMGQKTADIVEQLDEFIAQAMATDFDDSNKSLRGKIQYGYNSTSDTNLVSPNYEFYISGAASNIKFNSGLATYTFNGVSLLSADCDNTQSFPAHDNWDLFDVVLGILYKYYGDPDNPPKYVKGVSPDENNYHYLIDIPDELYNDGLTAKENGFSCEATSGMTPWQYCMKLLDDNPLTKSQVESGKYNDILSELNYAERPKYLMYLEDIEGQHVIRIRHVTPTLHIEDGKVISTELDETDTIKINYDITWGLQNKNNIVVEWSPQIDLQLYLIRNALYRSGKHQLLTNKSYNIDADILNAINENQFLGIAQSVQTPFDAQLTIVGIPADPPLGAYITIKPRILESVSRTAGVYMITGCTDNISTNGIYTTTLDVYRVKSTINDLINDEYKRQEKIYIQQQENQTVEWERRQAEVYATKIDESTYNYSRVGKTEAVNKKGKLITNIDLQSEPVLAGKDIILVTEDTVVDILGVIDAFYYIRTPNGTAGYTHSANVAVYKE